jgi:hypothetical protein
MTVQPVLEPLIAAGLTAVLRPDRRLAISPSQRITPAIDAHIRAHRDELIVALSALPVAAVQPLDWPPPEPPWWAEWMETDDARRAATMAAGKARLQQRGRL